MRIRSSREVLAIIFMRRCSVLKNKIVWIAMRKLFFWISLNPGCFRWGCGGLCVAFLRNQRWMRIRSSREHLAMILMIEYSVSFWKEFVWIVLLFFLVALQEDESTSYSIFPIKSGFCAVEGRKHGWDTKSEERVDSVAVVFPGRWEHELLLW